KAQLSGTNASDETTSDELAKIIEQVAGATPTNAPEPAFDLTTALKLDSLGRVELMSALEERFQIDIDEAAFTDATTLGEVERLISTGTTPAPTIQYPRPAWSQRFPVTWLRLVAFYLLLLPITRLLSPTRVLRREHLRDVRGPALFIANHVTLVDQSLILAALPGRFSRRMAIAMDRELPRSWCHPPDGTGWLT